MGRRRYQPPVDAPQDLHGCWPVGQESQAPGVCAGRPCNAGLVDKTIIAGGTSGGWLDVPAGNAWMGQQPVCAPGVKMPAKRVAKVVQKPEPFTGFPSGAFQFLKDLDKNQDKEWMALHKDTFESTLRAPMGSLVADLSVALLKKGPPLVGDPVRSIFRLNRDIRFSKDKRPYKTSMGAVLSRDGSKDAPGVLYIHVDPKGSFVAAGFYRLEPPLLHRVRTAMHAQPAVWTRLEKALAAKGLILDREDALKRIPSGFTSTTPLVDDALKLKSWIVRRELGKADVSSARLVQTMVDFAQAAAPLLKFGWAALEREAG